MEFNETQEERVVFLGTIEEPGASWIRIQMGHYNLGGRSYVQFAGQKDGAVQKHTARTLPPWNDWSAFFNGDSVDVTLHVAPGERGIFVEIEQAAYNYPGEMLRADPDPPDSVHDLCGSDNRNSSTALRVGRLQNGNPNALCTVYLIANGALLTAGHRQPFIVDGYTIAEFDIRGSGADGQIVQSFPQNQFPIDTSSLNFANNGQGDDYCVFGVGPNTLGEQPAVAQGAFFRLSHDLNPSDVRVTGCGIDNTPAGTGSQNGSGGCNGTADCCELDGGGNCTCDCNSNHRTLQTSVGSYLGENTTSAGIELEYQVDTGAGNSGSPVIDFDLDVAIGIHTNSGCTDDTGNTGTSFAHSPLQDAINDFPGADTVYVDKDHPVPFDAGTMFRPWHFVAAGVFTASPGGIVSIVTGSYNETLTIDQPMTLIAPVGSVVIGR